MPRHPPSWAWHFCKHVSGKWLMFYVLTVKSHSSSLVLWFAAEGRRRHRRREPQTSCEKEKGTERLKRRTPRLLSPFSPDGEEVEGPSLLLPPLRAEQHVFPPNHLVACSHPGCPTHHRSAVLPNHFLYHPFLPRLVSAPSPVRWIPWRVCAFSCFPSFILSFQAFFILLSLSLPIDVKIPVSLKSPASSTSVPVHPISAASLLSEYTSL